MLFRHLAEVTFIEKGNDGLHAASRRNRLLRGQVVRLPKEPESVLLRLEGAILKQCYEAIDTTGHLNGHAVIGATFCRHVLQSVPCALTHLCLRCAEKRNELGSHLDTVLRRLERDLRHCKRSIQLG